MNITAVREELLRIWKIHGELSAPVVLEEATPPASVLHNEFEWDDGEAAHQYRLTQAAGLIRSVKLNVVRDDPDSPKVREWVASTRTGAPDAKPGSYVRTRDLTGMERQMLLQRMQREMQAMRNRYEALAEFWQALDRLAAQRPGKGKGKRKAG